MPIWLAVIGSRVRALFMSRQMDEDLDHEMAAHLDLLTRDGVARGLPHDQARRAAALRFGGVAQLREQHREDRGIPLLETTLQDVRYALRTLRRDPGFAAVASLTLAVGIGAGAAVFSVASAVLLRPLPYRAPGELVRIFEANPLRRWTRNIASPANYADWRARNVVFSDMAAYEQFNSEGSGASDVFLTGHGEPQGFKALGVTGNIFSLLGASPLLGRVLSDEETLEGKARTVVISYGLWQGAFGGDPGIIGKTITLSGRNTEVVGVMPAAFFFPGRDVQAWLPVAYAPSVFTNSRRPHWLGVIARRRAGVSLAQALQNMETIASDLERQYPDTNTQMGVRLEGFHSSLAYEPGPAFRLVTAAVSVLFLMICINTANLQLGRGLGRARELAIRRALGAERRRLVRQLLTEALILSLAGGVLGFAVAVSAQAVLTKYASAVLPIFASVRPDSTVVLFAAGLSLLAPIVFGVLPAFAAARATELHGRGDTATRATAVLRAALVTGEVALSIVLAVGAVLLIRSLVRLQAVDPGFEPGNTVAFTVTLPTARYPDPVRRYLTIVQIERQLREAPGVQGVGAVSRLALRGADWTSDGTVEGRDPNDFERDLRHKSVTPGYFAAAGVRLLAGRFFDEHDTRDRPGVTIVNQALSAVYLRGDDPIGRRIRFGRPSDTGPWITIVGVIGNEKQDGLEKPVEPEAFVPITQQLQNPMTFVVRSSQSPEALLKTASARVRAVDKDLALMSVTTLDELVRTSMLDHRLRTGLIAAFAVIAMLLAALGIYGVLAYSVSQRSREIGLRLALGARPSTLFGMVVGQGLRPVVLGACLGLAAALLLTRLAQSLLFGVDAIDPPAYAAALAALAALATAACAVPAWRAIHVDPLTALREE